MLNIIDFCVNRKKITNGMAIINDPAAKLVNSFFLSDTKLHNPNASVCLSALLNTIFGKMKSIHGPVKLEIPRNVMIGFVIGRIIVPKILKWPAPSILAASSRFFETVSM